MTMEFQNVHSHPEWRRLITEIGPLVASGKIEYTYEELNALAGCDVQSVSGRRQFLKFRKQALCTWEVWFENVRGKGYQVIRPDEHTLAARRRSGRAKRQMRIAHEIVVHTKLDELSEAAKKSTLETQALLGVVIHQLSVVNRKVSVLAAKAAVPMLPPSKTEIEQIANAIGKSN